MTAVSVIVNCYNGAAYLREAIDSVIAQTFGDWELVLWDNRSTDGSAAIAREYADPRIRYFLAPEHTVLGEARRRALAEAKGEWIGFLDTDDRWLPWKLERQMAAVRGASDPVGLVYGRTYGFTPDGKRWEFPYQWAGRPLRRGRVVRELLIHGNFMPFVSVLVKREALDAVGGFPDDYTFCEDYYLNVAIAEKYRVGAVEEFCAEYRVHDASLSAQRMIAGYEESKRILERWRRPLTPAEYDRRRAELATLIGAKRLLGGEWRTGLRDILRGGSVRFAGDRLAYFFRRGWQTGYWSMRKPG